LLPYIAYVYFHSPENLALIEATRFHPFYVIAFLYSAYYGTKHSVVVSVLLSTVYITLAYYQIDLLREESLFQYKYFRLPVFLSVLSVLIGEIRQRTWERQRETKRKLKSSLEELSSNKDELSEMGDELFEMRKRYATLGDSFQNNLNMLHAFDNVRFDEVIDQTIRFLKSECDVGRAIYFSRYDIRLKEDELVKEMRLIEKVLDKGSTYTIRDEVLGEEEEEQSNGDLKSLGFEMVIAFSVNDEVEGFFFLGEIPFLSLNIFNQKKILNILDLSSTIFAKGLEAEKAYGKSETHILFKVYKREKFIREMEGLTQAANEFSFPLNIATFHFDFAGDLPQVQQEKILMLSSHLIRESNKGGEPVGLDLKEGRFFVAYLRKEADVSKVFEETQERIGSIIPASLKDSVSLRSRIHNFKEKGYEALPWENAR